MDVVSISGRPTRGCSVCHPLPTYGNRFYCNLHGLAENIAQICIEIQYGGHTFRLHVPRAFAPCAIYGKETMADGSSLWELTQSIMRSCADHFFKFTETHTTLKDYLIPWHTRVLCSNEELAIGEITSLDTINLEGITRGIEYHDRDIPRYDWQDIEVLEKETDSHFQVRMGDRLYGCYAPDQFAKRLDYVSFLQEVRAWKRVTQSSRRPDAIPRLVGLVFSPEEPNRVRAVLYDWIKACTESQTLKQLHIDDFSKGRRKTWFQQIYHAVSFLHDNGASWTRRDCNADATTRVAISTKGHAFLKYIHFGGLRRNRFVPYENYDMKALEKVRRFLRLGPEPAYARVANRQPFRFMGLPPNVRNMIYDLLLVYPGNIQWLGKYRYQGDTVGARCEALTASGLFFTSRQVRRESLSYLLRHNTIQVDAFRLRSFLKFPLPLQTQDGLRSGKVGSFLRRVVVTLISDDPESWQEQCKGFEELKRHCSLEYLEVIFFHTELRSFEWHNPGSCVEALPSLESMEESEFDVLIDRFDEHQKKYAKGRL